MVACAAAALLLANPLPYRTEFPLPSLKVGDGWGVNIHFTDEQPGELAHIARLGMKWVRMDLAWASVERERGVYDFSAYDRLVAACAGSKLRILFILDYGNDLYQAGAPSTPEARAAFCRFVERAVKRYQGRGVLWEIWNEPNILPFWPPSPSVGDYILLAKEAARAIRGVASQEWIIGPATSGFDWPFLQECFRAGLLKDFDAVSVHPYRQTPPETAIEDFQKLRAMVARHAPPGKQIPLLSGEWGYSDVWAGQSQEKKAAFAVRQHLANLAAGVPLSIYYDWKNDGLDPKEPEHHFGLVTHDRAEKDASRAVAALSRELAGYEVRGAIPAGKGVFGLLLSKGGQRKAAVWSAGEPSDAELGLAWTAGRRLKGSAPGPTGPKLRAELMPVVLDIPKGDPYGEALDRIGPLPQFVVVGTQAEAERASADFVAAFQRLHPSWKTTWMMETPFASTGWAQLGKSGAAKLAGDAMRTLDVLPGFGSDLTVKAKAALGGAGLEGSMVIRPMRRVSLAPLPGEDTLEAVLEGFEPGESVDAQWQRGAASGRVALRPGQTIRIPNQGEGPLELRVQGRKAAVLLPSWRKEPLWGQPERLATRAFTEGDGQGGSAAAEQMSGGMLRLKYSFGEGWKYALFALPEPLLLKEDKGRPQELCAWVTADGSGNWLRMRFVDSTGQTFQTTWGRLDWKGERRLVRMPFSNKDGGFWGGASDGVIHWPIRLETPFLIDSALRKANSGEVMVAAPTIIYGGAGTP